MAWTKIVPGTDQDPWEVLAPDSIPAAAEVYDLGPVTEFPAAAVGYRGYRGLLIAGNEGPDTNTYTEDTEWVCLYDTADFLYHWRLKGYAA